jgi:hypothetical protein
LASRPEEGSAPPRFGGRSDTSAAPPGHKLPRPQQTRSGPAATRTSMISRMVDASVLYSRKCRGRSYHGVSCWGELLGG